MKNLRNDSGISENIGVILMVSVVVIGVAIVSVTMMSEPTPEEIPNADIIIGCEEAAGGANVTFNVTLYHNGGDTLIPDDLMVRAYDSNDQLIENVTLYEGESTDPFAVSDTLTFWTDTRPKRISVIYTGGSSSAPLKSLDIGSTVEDDQAALESASVDTTPTLTATPTGGGEPTQTVTATVTPTMMPTPSPCHDTLLNTANPKEGYLEQGGYMEFRVRGPWSEIKVTGTVYDLAINDTVQLVIGNDGKGEIFATPTEIDKFDKFDDVAVFINGEYKESGIINKIYINTYDNYESTLNLIVPSSNHWTDFWVDGARIIPSTQDNRPITLYGLKVGTGSYPETGSYAQFNLDNKDMGIWYQGGAENFQITTF